MSRVAQAQSPILWTDPQVIPYLDPNTETPFLLADSNGGIHAFSSQKVPGTYEYVVVYNYWSRETGWSKPVDVLLSPLFDEAHAPAAYLDHKGIIHLVFYGGHDVSANIYYSQVYATEAANADAWTPPVAIATGARPPITVWIDGDADDNLYVLFGGNPEGTGIYATESRDGGDSWTLPELVSATYSETLWPYGLRMHYGESGRLYATWIVLNRRAWGTTLYVSTYDFDARRWNDPVEVDYGVETGILGVQSPSMIEYDGELFLMYDNGLPDQGVVRLIRRSSDGGRTWTEAIRPFPEHVGGNGPAAFVVDSNHDLRVFFGQRTNAIVKDQVHGMWYSEWHSGTKSWGGVKYIVSGPLVQDSDGDKGFDPSLARSAVSQGNLLMIVWRTDPGNGANGAWYSYTELEAPFYALQPLPTPEPVVHKTVTITATLGLTKTAEEELAALGVTPLAALPTIDETHQPPEVRQLANPA
ncbi:MAG: exo-alpha-sialidase, partial [Caldilineaceae bacterium]|nr:exo-alpha-sialidase [Caldilineaceae bacterium]